MFVEFSKNHPKLISNFYIVYEYINLFRTGWYVQLYRYYLLIVIFCYVHIRYFIIYCKCGISTGARRLSIVWIGSVESFHCINATWNKFENRKFHLKCEWPRQSRCSHVRWITKLVVFVSVSVCFFVCGNKLCSLVLTIKYMLSTYRTFSHRSHTKRR